MNAKKIMGAVLVALLAAALFVGAGAADIADANGKVVFVNQKLVNTTYEASWIGANGAVTPSAAEEAGYVYFPTGTQGVYTYKNGTDTYTLTVKVPELTVVGLANKGNVNAEYKFIPSPLYANTEKVNVTVTSPATDLSADNFTMYLTFPDGTEEKMNDVFAINTELVGSAPEVGKYSIRAVYNADVFVNGTLYSDRITAPVAFDVVAGGAATISAAADKVLVSSPVKLTITGQPGVQYNVTYAEYAFTVDGNQIGLPSFNAIGDDAQQKDGIQFIMPNTGKVEFAVKANESAVDDSEKITVKANKTDAKSASVTIKFEKGTISAKADASSYFVGDTVKITGTSTAGPITNLTIEGTNFKNTTVKNLVTITTTGNDFEFELNTGAIVDKNKKLDVGTYTLTIKTASAETIVALVLKQPFISIAEAPEVVVQGEDAEFTINAEATDEIAYYIFGTNFFKYATTEENAEGEDGEDIQNQFVFTIKGENTENMSLGQYFVVIQHPMYDGKFQVEGDANNADNWTIVGANGASIVPINVKERQTANAAQALCDALDIQTIDDMYVKYSFFIVDEDETSTMSELPTEVVKGETIVISGVDTANDGATVTAQMLSTAFAAVPKETTGSAAFIVVSTKIAEDGTWELTLDTSDLNVDEYSLSVAINGINKETVTVNVVEGAETPDTPDTPDVPDTPDTPDTPTEPTTPGFGALAALAGLGAVAVLLLRRE